MGLIQVPQCSFCVSLLADYIVLAGLNPRFAVVFFWVSFVYSGYGDLQEQIIFL